MLKRLFLDGCFTHNNVTFDFEKGLTGIVGQNEAGKSLIVEMIRYALFGTMALRGKAEDYKKLHVELDFYVNGDSYSVIRKGTKVELTGARQASGTKPVNAAISSILGYGLDVFDVANACNQGNIEALSNMAPTARRQMVDKTIGLNVLDDLIAFCGTEGNANKRAAELLRSRLVEPIQPDEPEGYVPSNTIDLGPLTANVREYHQLQGQVSNAPKAPVAPAPCPVGDEVEAHQKRRGEILDENGHIYRQLDRLKPETLTLAQIEEQEAQVQIWNRAKQRDRLLAQGHLCCPSCDHKWPVAGDALDQFQDLPPVIAEPAKIDTGTARSLLGNNAKIAELKAQIQEAPADRSTELQQLVQHRAQVKAYEAAKLAYDRFHEGLEAKQDRLRELVDSEAQLRELQVAKEKSLRYEGDVLRYNLAVGKFTEDKAAVDYSSAKAEEYLKARELLQALKTSVKSHLLPSLNKVASVLLAQMTGGERGSVVVSDDFEILIDGQAIGTLSGSGKAVANLAVRLALGQILTNRVFSVFLADEVDAAMDDDRAGHTAEALRRLKDSVHQVVLVTHKRPATDHLFELRK